MLGRSCRRCRSPCGASHCGAVRAQARSHREPCFSANTAPGSGLEMLLRNKTEGGWFHAAASNGLMRKPRVAARRLRAAMLRARCCSSYHSPRHSGTSPRVSAIAWHQVPKSVRDVHVLACDIGTYRIYTRSLVKAGGIGARRRPRGKPLPLNAHDHRAAEGFPARG